MQYFPQAVGHLAEAGRASNELVAVWNGLLDADLFDTGIVTDADKGANGAGTIVAYSDFPTDAREQLTAIFRRYVDELWACLDALVTESVAIFSIHHRLRSPSSPRFFPVADSEEGFDALLEQDCLDGVLSPQFSLIRASQPFHHEPGDIHLDELRAGLRYLVGWSNGVDRGSLIGAWATAVDPEIHVEPPARAVLVHPSPPGELIDERVVATYTIDGMPTDATVSGHAGTYIDIAFPDGFQPAGPDDTLNERLRRTTHAVRTFAVAFTNIVKGTPGSKRLPHSANTPADTMWIEANRSLRRWSADELQAVADSELGLAVVRDAETLTLIIATPQGTFERIIPDASPLPQRVPRGTAAENAIQDAAATWGLPDFVMRPQQERKGSGLREVGDGLLIVGERGVVVQAKSRDTEPGDPDREARWIDKKILGAAKQADGTVRQLCSKTSEMTNGRGRAVVVDGNTISWVTAVIIDHPTPPTGHRIPKIDSRIPAVVLVRRDWEFLFNQLKSTRAVVDYLHRVDGPAEMLGSEPQRYYELAAADLETVDTPLDPLWQAYAGAHHSVPCLPAAPAGSDDDEAHAMVRIMCEDIAESPLTERTEQDRLRALAAIDRLPVGYRSSLGQMLLDGLQEARNAAAGDTFWRWRTFRTTAPGEIQLSFGVCPELSESTRAIFEQWFLLRHHERSAVEALDELMSVGVLLTPRHDDRREWDTTMLAVIGDPGLTPEQLAVSRETFNRPRDNG